MDEHDIETLLARYQPAAPRPALRAKILDAAPVPIWPWAAAAAVLLAAALGFNAGSNRLAGVAAVEPPRDTREAAIQDLAAMLGGDETARRFAETEVAAGKPPARVPLLPAFEDHSQ